MPPASRNILLATSASWIGISRVPRILAEAGARVVLLGPPRRLAARSRYVAEVVPAPAEAEGTLGALRRLLAGRSFDWVILGDDEILRAAVNDAGARREPWFPVPAAPSMLVSKASFATAMASSGLPFPPSEVAVGPVAARKAAETLGFPVIVKADASFGGKEIFRAEVPEDLQRVPDEAKVVVQRFVDGEVGSTAILFHAGRPLWWMSAHKYRVHPKPFGPSCERRYVHFPALEERLAVLGALLRMTGLCGVDWIRPRGSPEPLLLELNGRPPPWVHLHRQFGTDLPGAIRAMLEGKPAVVRPPLEAPQPEVAMFPQDALRALEEGDWRGFWRGFLTEGDAPRDDPRLLLALRKFLLKRAWLRLWGR